MMRLLGFKFLRSGIAWGIGSIIYFIYAIATVYDGIPSIICQPFMAIGVSLVISTIALIIGLPLMLLTPYRPQWLASIVAGMSLFLGFMLLLVPNLFTFMLQGITRTIPLELTSPDFTSVFLGYFIVIFTVVNWPRLKIEKSLKRPL